MCFGYDGEGALRRSLEEKGASRRSLFRGAAAGVAGAAVLGSGLAAPASATSSRGNGRNGRLGSHLPWADPRRGWDFVSTGHGDVPWEQCFRMLNTIGYDGPISVEWEDAGMDRLVGAPEALEFVRRLAFDAPEAAFDAAFSTKD